MDFGLKMIFLLLLFGSFFHQNISATDDVDLFDNPDDWMDYSLPEPECDSYPEVVEPFPPCGYDRPDFIINNHTCNFRGENLRELQFKWRTSWYCYLYLQPSLRNLTATPVRPRCCTYRNTMPVRCLLINTLGGTECYPVDESIPEIVEEIGRTLLSDLGVQKWSECSRNGMKCCENLLTGDTPEEGSCEATWDGWTCWNKAPAGIVAQELCPEYAYSNNGPACHHFSSKQCLDNSTWNVQTWYGSCSITSRVLTRVRFHIICLSISVAIALPAVIVLFSYKKLRVRRLALHRNLLIAIMLRNILVIIMKSTIHTEELTSSSSDTVMNRNEWPCKMLSSLEKLAASATFTCMLIDGFFLHRMIVAVFRNELRISIVYVIGAAATIVPVIVWIVLMVTLNNSSCWIVYTVSNIQWALDAPRLLMLAINVIFLIDILRVLLTKLKRSENAHNLSTAKATLFLMPLFGVQFLITAWRPSTTSCDWEQAYYFFTYIMDGLQGIMVAMLYCYFNKEVHFLLRATYKRTENVVSTRFRSEVRDRRETFSTMLVDNNRSSNNGLLDIEEDNRRITPEVVKTFTTFKPSATDSGINDEEQMEMEKMESGVVNDVELLNNCYTPRQDGFLNIEFENDYSDESYDKLRRPSEQQTLNKSNVRLAPRIPRNCSDAKSEYQNFEFIVNSANDIKEDNKDNNDYSTFIVKSNADESPILDNNLERNAVPNDVIYLNRPLVKNQETFILPQVENSDINENINYNVDSKTYTDLKESNNTLEHQESLHLNNPFLAPNLPKQNFSESNELKEENGLTDAFDSTKRNNIIVSSVGMINEQDSKLDNYPSNQDASENKDNFVETDISTQTAEPIMHDSGPSDNMQFLAPNIPQQNFTEDCNELKEESGSTKAMSFDTTERNNLIVSSVGIKKEQENELDNCKNNEDFRVEPIIDDTPPKNEMRSEHVAFDNGQYTEAAELRNAVLDNDNNLENNAEEKQFDNPENNLQKLITVESFDENQVILDTIGGEENMINSAVLDKNDSGVESIEIVENDKHIAMIDRIDDQHHKSVEEEAKIVASLPEDINNKIEHSEIEADVENSDNEAILLDNSNNKEKEINQITEKEIQSFDKNFIDTKINPELIEVEDTSHDIKCDEIDENSDLNDKENRSNDVDSEIEINKNMISNDDVNEKIPFDPGLSEETNTKNKIASEDLDEKIYTNDYNDEELGDAVRFNDQEKTITEDNNNDNNELVRDISMSDRDAKITVPMIDNQNFSKENQFENHQDCDNDYIFVDNGVEARKTEYPIYENVVHDGATLKPMASPRLIRNEPGSREGIVSPADSPLNYENLIFEKQDDEKFLENDDISNYESFPYEPELNDDFELKINSGIDPQEIYEQVRKKYEDHAHENLKPENVSEEERKDSSGIYEDIVFDPQKLCPNRPEENDIVFV